MSSVDPIGFRVEGGASIAGDERSIVNAGNTMMGKQKCWQCNSQPPRQIFYEAFNFPCPAERDHRHAQHG